MDRQDLNVHEEISNFLLDTETANGKLKKRLERPLLCPDIIGWFWRLDGKSKLPSLAIGYSGDNSGKRKNEPPSPNGRLKST